MVARQSALSSRAASDGLTNLSRTQQQIPRQLRREHCSLRHVHMTLSLAFLSPMPVKAAVEGRLPRGVGVEQLRDLPIQWDRQLEALGLSPAY